MSNAVKLPRVYINRKSWTRNTMCNYKNGRCCAIGFVAKQQLIKEGVKKPTPSEIEERGDAIASDFPGVIEANDQLSGKERVKALRKAFKKAGYQLVLFN